MKRSWNSICGEEGTEGAQAKATALGCLSDESFVRSVIACLEAVNVGASVRVTAERPKVDPATGDPLEDHTEPGDYVTVAYGFRIDGETNGENWDVEREPAAEGDRRALGFSAALSTIADEEFCESMVQCKCALDRFGGQVFVKPYVRAESVVGYLFHYEHLVRDSGEPDADLETPPELPEPVQVGDDVEGDEPADEDAAEAKAEPVAAEG